MNHAVPLPIFQVEPLDTFVIKNKPATLQCKAMHALQINFKCNGLKNSTSNVQSEVFVDPQTGIRNIEASINITRDNVEEYFGKDKFKCECIAMSSRGLIKSNPATIEVACEYNDTLYCNLFNQTIHPKMIPNVFGNGIDDGRREEGFRLKTYFRR